MDILIVDDMEDIRKMMKRRLREIGWHLHFAENGKIGVKMALSLRPDILLMDMHMPVMDGFTAVRILREKNYNGLIVALTASVLIEDVEATRRAGCDIFIPKPIGKNFKEKIKQMVKEKETTGDAQNFSC